MSAAEKPYAAGSSTRTSAASFLHVSFLRFSGSSCAARWPCDLYALMSCMILASALVENCLQRARAAASDTTRVDMTRAAASDTTRVA
eukprot:601143-Prymnesium_polylepis.2